jgi:hypothetical protein
MLNKKALSAAVTQVAAAPVYVEDVFSTWLYNGTDASQTITNGIDLAGEGGMVWIKSRNRTNRHRLTDTARGVTKSLDTTTTAVEATETGGVTAFNSDGFSIGTDTNYNGSSSIYASWTFRKQAKFFDIVTYTGNGANRTIAHNLGSVPGCIIVKRTDTADNWQVYHRANTTNPETDYLVLNSILATADSETRWNDTLPTSTVFSLGTGVTVNENGGTYVAYLFAHDAGGFGDDGLQNVITCGSYTGNGSAAGPTVTLGWEPQWLLIKRTGGASEDWNLIDCVRGNTVSNTDYELNPNSTAVETPATFVTPTSTGFLLNTLDEGYNASGSPYIYIAIRRGPMKTPTDATKVFMPTIYTGTNVDNRLIDTTIAPDMVMIRQRNDTVVPGLYTGARLTGQEFLITGSTAAGATDADSFDAQIVSSVEYGNAFSSMNGVWVGNDTTRKFNANTTSNNHIIHAFKRAPGFFDVVCYQGTSSNRTISHNLGVAPELMIVKRRAVTSDWQVYAGSGTEYLVLNTNAAVVTGNADRWNSTAPAAKVFSLGSSSTVNATGSTYIAFLFASCSGVSKVGSYTGNGSTQTIDCGFTAGARYVLIKRTDSTGNWLVYDTARGITTGGNDPQLALNLTSAETTTKDVLDTDNSGFKLLNSDQNTNVNGATYIFLAIA